MVESARTNITAATVARLVEGFGVDVSDLYAPTAPFAKRKPGRPPKRRASPEAPAGPSEAPAALAAPSDGPDLKPP